MGFLQRIILIHTHLEGVVELLVDDHANICGNNAAGKTTLQRLIPVFYGEQPNRVVPRTRKNFHQFYLPFGNSYVIYEYRRESDEVVMVVLTRHAQTGVEYRFIASAYDPVLFLDSTGEGPKGVAYGDLTTRLRQTDIGFSPKLEATSEYRSVILNDLASLQGARRENQRLRQFALQYSLVKPGHRLRHMEKLVSAVHARQGKMETLKTMLAAIFEEDGVALPVTRLRNDQTRHWMRQMRQSLGLQQLEKQFAAWQEMGRALSDVEGQLRRIKPRLQADLADQQQALADTEASLQKIRGQLEALRVDYQNTREALEDTQQTHQQEYTGVERRIDDIQSRYEAYLEKGMPGLAQQMEELPAWREDLEAQQTHLRLLESEIGEARQAFEARKLALLEKLQQQRTKAEKRITGIRQKLDTMREAHQQRRDALDSQYQSQRDEVLTDFNRQATELTRELTGVTTRLEGELLSSGQQQSRQEAQVRVEHQQQRTNEAANTVTNMLEQAQRAANAHEEALHQQQVLRQQRLACEKACYRLQQQCDPETGSLRHFLRAYRPGWEGQIGKIIREPLLERKDLAPQLTEDVPNLWGIQLDLGRLDTPDYAQDEVALQQALANAGAELEQARKQEEQHAGQVRRKEQALQTRQEAVGEARRHQQQAEDEVNYARAARDQLLAELESKQQQARRELGQQQETLHKRQEQLQASRHERLTELEHQHRDQRLEMKADFTEAEGQEHAHIEQIEADMRQRERDAKEQVDELEAHLHAELVERGIDEKVYREASHKVKALNERIYAVEARRDELKAYESFMRVEWQGQKPELLAREGQLRQLLATDKTSLQQAQTTYREARGKAQQTQAAQQEAIQQHRQYVEALSPLVDKLAGLNLPTTGSTGHMQDDLQLGGQQERIERAHHALETFDKRVRQMEAEQSRFNAELTRDASSNFVDHLNQELAKLQADGRPHALDYLPLYANLLKILRSQQVELVQQGRNIGGDLNKFFTVFNDLKRRIRAQSRRLSEEVANDLVLEGISKAQVRISSTIDELEFWQPLQRFSQLYEAWEASGDLVPGEAYLDALGDVVELLRQDQKYTFESLLQLELNLTEGGNELIIRNDRQLLESSSHGMAYLILCQFLLAFTRLLRKDAQVTIHWPIDEIGTLAYRNVEQLFKACEKNRIFVLGAFPNAESDVLTLFKHRYLIERDSPHSETRRLKRIEPRLSPLAAKLKALGEEVKA